MMRQLTSLVLTGIVACTAQAQLPPSRSDDAVPAQVETMYQRGLQYLAQSQGADGKWNDTNGSEPGVVGLAVVAFLAHGEDPNVGPYAKPIRKGLDYIFSQQKESNGYIGNSMYNHGFATLALAEAYGMVDDPRIAPALKKAVDLILSAQKRNERFHAWRYTPDSMDADTTVTGCQLVALYAARNAGLAVPDTALKQGLDYLKSCQNATDGTIGYTSPAVGKQTLTAIGSLCFALAKDKDSAAFRTANESLKKRLDYREPYYPYYYEYYMAQALFHYDDAVWNDWNERNIRYMSTTQTRDGSWPGNQGAAFSTAGALLSLAVNFRFLPIYEK